MQTCASLRLLRSNYLVLNSPLLGTTMDKSKANVAHQQHMQGLPQQLRENQQKYESVSHKGYSRECRQKMHQAHMDSQQVTHMQMKAAESRFQFLSALWGGSKSKTESEK